LKKKIAEYKKVIKAFSGKRIMIVGDAMLDAYLTGKVNRISPEAPVPVLEVKQKLYKPGGAANVALNIKALGAEPYLFSITGDDAAGEQMRSILKNEGLKTDHIIKIKQRVTTVKTRVLSQSHQLLRFDEEQTEELKTIEQQKVLLYVLSGIEKIKPHAIIIEDYDKGMLSKGLIEAIIANANKNDIPVAVDPKFRNFWHYKHVTLFKPNLRELSEALGININASDMSSVTKGDQLLRSKLMNQIALITLSDKGVFVSNYKNRHHIPAHLRNIADVSGAGDTVISVAALCLTVDANIQTLAALSNLAGGLVCEKWGVVPITQQQLLEECVK
jgi:rfaE bifunctional protein kinase chain/domain